MSQQQSSNRLTKHPPHKLPPPNNAAMSCSPLPSPPLRMSSFSKRHASFDSPREIPLPSPSQNNSSSAQFSYFPPTAKAEPSVLTKSRPSSMSKQITENGFSPTFDETADETGWTNVSNRNSGAEVPSEAPHSHRNQPVPSSITSELTGIASSSQIHPYSRPYSVPHAHSEHGHPEPSSPSTKHKPLDRMSSASLPLPTQIPFHALPKVSSQGGATGATADTAHKFGLDSLVSDVARSSTVELEEENENHRPTTTLKGSDGDSESTSSLPSVSSKEASRSASRRGSPAHDGKVERLPKESLPRPLSHPHHIPNYPHLRDPPQPFSHHMSLKPPSAESSLPAATALRHSATVTSSGNSRSIPPPEPPIILPSPPLPPASATASSSQSSCSTFQSFTSAVITDTPITTPNSNSTCSSQGGLPPRSAMLPMDPPYAPFLSHSPPPADSWIEVETTPSDYKLNVRLPGFQRDGITLATKKRRILHVVADSWGTGGGHFERRISFGYDADLAQVRAEFDGEMLRVIVPRRVQPVWGSGAGMGYAM